MAARRKKNAAVELSEADVPLQVMCDWCRAMIDRIGVAKNDYGDLAPVAPSECPRCRHNPKCLRLADKFTGVRVECGCKKCLEEYRKYRERRLLVLQARREARERRKLTEQAQRMFASSGLKPWPAGSPLSNA